MYTYINNHKHVHSIYIYIIYNTKTKIIPLHYLLQPSPLRLLTSFIRITWRIMDHMNHTADHGSVGWFVFYYILT